MFRLWRPLLLLVSTWLVSPDAAGAPAAVDPVRAFAERFRTTLEQRGIPGGAFAVVADGRIVLAQGVGVRGVDDPQPVDADTVFRIASVSKTFAAQLTAQLVAEGRLHWNDRVVDSVPELAFRDQSHTHALQLQHLLGQSTGIVSNAYDNLLDARQPLERILPQFRTLEPLCAPGSCYTYQNILFALVEPAIERTTRQSYATLMQARLFDPLGMASASLGMQAYFAASNRARPHVRRGKRWVPTKVENNYYQVAPAAGINASANDLGRWLLAQLGSRPDVVTPDTVRVITQPRVRTPRDLRRRGWRELLDDAHYGLGWRIYRVGGEEIVLHSGWVRGFVADVSYSRTHRTGLVILLNAESGLLGELGSSFWAQVLRQKPQVAAVSTPAAP